MSEREREQAEEQRVVAEDNRVQAEEERVDAEAGDGGSALELGRVQAEEGRVTAETGRQSERTKMYQRVSTLVALPIAFIVLVPLAVGIYFVNNRAVDAERKARIISLTASQVIQERAYGAQLEGCERGNVLRRQMAANSDVLLDFVLSASNTAKERSKQFRSVGNIAQADINLKASKKYAQYAKALKTIPPVDCLSAIPKP